MKTIKKIYISGAITGIPYAQAMRNFVLSSLDARLRFPDAETINPMVEAPYREGNTWEDYMKEDLKLLLQCDAIFMQSNYKGSKGAMAEKQVAEWCGLEVFYNKK